MADKLDFMSELAKDVEAKKHGRESTFGSINDFVPKEHHREETDFDKTQDYEAKQEPKPAAKPRPAQQPSPAPSAAEPAEPAAEPTAEPDGEVSMGQDSEQPEGEGKPQSFEDLYETAPAQNNDAQAGPASFQEEVRVKVDKPKKRLSPVGIGIVAALVALVAFLIWFFLIRAKITLPDFAGKNLSDVSSWAKQNKIQSTSIATSYVFSMEYDNDVVISQTPAAGTKVKPDTPINLTVSKGPDPDEAISFPTDIKSMTYEELTEWKNENKLSKTKITTEYNTAFPAGSVISYEVKNGSETDFRRNTTLNIKTSKGPAPAGQVTVENFVNKNYNEAMAWANNKKVNINKQEVNSDKVDSGYVISQTPAAGQAMQEGETITFVVSKGKGVKVPDLVGYTKEQLEAWKSSKNNTLTVVTKSIYNEAPEGTVIAQAVPPGTVLDSGDVLLLTISLYMPILETNSRAWIGKDYLELRAWCDAVNDKGVDIQAGEWGPDFQPIYSDEFPTPGQVIKYACYYGTSDIADGCGRPLTANSRINYQRSLGPKTVKNAVTLTQADLASVQSMINFCDNNKMSCVVEPKSLNRGELVRVVFDGKQRSSNDDPFQDVVLQGTFFMVYYNEDAQPSPTPGPSVKDVVLTSDHLQSLTSISNFCSSSGLTCRFALDNSKSANITVYVDGDPYAEYDSDEKFQIILKSNQKLYVYYKEDLPSPTPTPTPEP